MVIQPRTKISKSKGPAKYGFEIPKNKNANNDSKQNRKVKKSLKKESK